MRVRSRRGEVILQGLALAIPEGAGVRIAIRDTRGEPDGRLEMDALPGTGFVSTHSLDSVVTDSAPGMACYTTGAHAANNQEGVYPANVVNVFHAPRVEYLAEYLHRTQGKQLGIVTTADILETIAGEFREAGAAEVHMRIASPPTRHSCFYGVDTPERTKLLAAKLSLSGMTDFIHADSLAFVSIDGLYKALGEAGRADVRPKFCDACFTGDYPTTLTDQDDIEQVDQFAMLAERVERVN